MSSFGVSKNFAGQFMGRFAFVPGVEKEGYPVYRQAHSRERPIEEDVLLHRWETLSLIKFPPELEMSGR